MAARQPVRTLDVPEPDDEADLDVQAERLREVLAMMAQVSATAALGGDTADPPDEHARTKIEPPQAHQRRAGDRNRRR